MEFLKFVFILGCVNFAASAVCKENGPCDKPVIATNYDIHEFKANTPADGWHMELGDVVARLHIAKVLQGKLLTLVDDYSQMCGKVKVDHDETNSQLHGFFDGFGDKVTNWQCTGSETLDGTLKCEYTSTLGKYNETDILYVTKTNNKSVCIVVMCFPIGQTGWWSMSTATSLNDEERKTVLDHMESIGFNREDVVNMYNDKCP